MKTFTMRELMVWAKGDDDASDMTDLIIEWDESEERLRLMFWSTSILLNSDEVIRLSTFLKKCVKEIT